MARKRDYTMKSKQLLDPVFVDETTLELARKRVAIAFDRYDHVAVMFSGGKDSTCVLHLAIDEHQKRGIKKPLDVIFFDEEVIPYETEWYARQVYNWPMVDMRWLSLPVQRQNACSKESPDWYPWAPEIEDLWCRPLPPESITLNEFDAWDFRQVENRLSIQELNGLLFHPKKHGRVGLMMGIRADESMTRRRGVLRKKEDNWIVHYTRFLYKVCRWPGCTRPTIRPTASTCEEHKGKKLPSTDMSDLGFIDKLYPIYDWKTEDVWTFTRDFAHDPMTGEPAWNRYYDHLEMAGIPHFRQRCAPPFGHEQLAGLWTFKVVDPDLWAKMVDRVPGVATAARYARTELYAFGERPTVPESDWFDDRAWMELIKSLLRNHEERIARLTAEQIQTFISRHNAKTGYDPILPDIPHPVTGLSWQFLAMLAQRTDPLNRKKPDWQVAQRGDPKALPRFRKKYMDGLRRRQEALREWDPPEEVVTGEQEVTA